MPPITAFAAAAVIAVLAWRGRALTLTGAVAAWLLGGLLLTAAGWPAAAILLVFFVGSSLVGRLIGRPTALEAKGETRDAWQVLANGGFATLGAWIGAQRGDLPLALWLEAAALAAAAADTWATAWGTSGTAEPLHIVTGRRVPRGTSGGITVRGTLGGLLGALGVAIIAAWAVPAAGGRLTATEGGLARLGRAFSEMIGLRVLDPLRIGAALVLIGVLGMLLDSLVGATLQARFRCDACGTDTESSVHRCGAATRSTGGVPWLTNDGVNALATGGALALGWMIWPWVVRG